MVEHATTEARTAEALIREMNQAIRLFGAERVLLTPDCGFATFADNPLSSAKVAEEKLSHISQARDRLRSASLRRPV